MISTLTSVGMAGVGTGGTVGLGVTGAFVGGKADLAFGFEGQAFVFFVFGFLVILRLRGCAKIQGEPIRGNYPKTAAV